MLSHALRASVNNTTIPPYTDPNFNQVSLLLHGDGTNGAQNNTFLDSSTNNFTITRNGNTTQGTNTPFSQPAGYWSNYNPTASYLTVATNAAFTYGVSDFTMECWVYLTTTGAIQYIIDQRNSGTANAVIPAIYVSASNVLTYFVSNAAQITGTTALTVGTWYHVAVSRSTLSTKMFLNGVQEGSTYTDANSYAASRVVIGSNAATAGNYLVGYVSNVRLVNGTGVYTTTFTPPTTPLTAITNTSLLTCQSNYLKDNSSNNFTITRNGDTSVQPFSPFAPTTAYSTSVNGGSMYFDGTGDYLSIADNVALQFGAGDFTIESYINLNALPTGPYFAFEIVGCWGYGGSYPYLFSVYNNSGTIQLRFLALTGATSIYANANIVINTWNHVAVTRNGTSLKMFLNGIEVTSGATFSSTLPSGPPTIIGSNSGTLNYFNGYQSSTRLIKGTAVYTANFTPPTAPLTAISGTSLLLSGTNAGIVDNAIKNDLETVGNAQVSTSVVKYGTGSMSFAGGSNYLSLPYSPQYDFGTGNFTVEFWMNQTTTGSYGTIFTTVQNYATANGFYISFGGGNNILNVSSNGGALVNSSSAISNGTWYHIAIVRNGTTLTIYRDGVSVGSTTNSTSFISNTPYIGTINTGTYSFVGYIDDLRVTKGIARYTANFTPPTAAFPNS